MGTTQKRIAIIGTGISGLAIASLLHQHHDITIFEKNDYIGGHSRTIDVNTTDGKIPVDTGFIVFNYRNYPLLTRLFDHLNVPIAKSDMSFSASIQHGWLEYGTQSLQNIFAQKRNLFRPEFWRMVRDIFKFNANAKYYLDKDPSYPMADCLRDLDMGEWFTRYFLLAMGGAIWSTPTREMLNFPAGTFIRFFDNHGLLTVNDQPQWYTVEGGSREYVTRLIAPFQHAIRLNAGVHKVIRNKDDITVLFGADHTAMHFDEVVFACHSDQALQMIDVPTTDEERILRTFRYQLNRAVLHSDISFMPRRKHAWASWVYLSDSKADDKPNVSLSYWMNNLQPLKTKTPMIVTLNPGYEPAPKLTHNDYWFEHPVFDEDAVRSQKELHTIQGQHRFWFCGAYQRYGFHEDGLGSAVEVARLMGIQPPW